MQKGTVKWFNPTKGYGFIKPSTGDKDVFVHISAVEKAGYSNLVEVPALPTNSSRAALANRLPRTCAWAETGHQSSAWAPQRLRSSTEPASDSTDQASSLPWGLEGFGPVFSA